jgi:hypothetical protein
LRLEESSRLIGRSTGEGGAIAAAAAAAAAAAVVVDDDLPSIPERVCRVLKWMSCSCFLISSNWLRLRLWPWWSPFPPAAAPPSSSWKKLHSRLSVSVLPTDDLGGSFPMAAAAAVAAGADGVVLALVLPDVEEEAMVRGLGGASCAV